MREIYRQDALWLHRQIYFILALLSVIILLFSLTAESFGQESYPNRPITIVAPFPPGGVADLTARPVAAAMEKVLKNPVVVVNKTGAAGAVGMSYVANSKPDGYTLLMALSSISIIPEADKLFDRKPAYTMDQLIPIGLISADPTIFVVNADRPWKNVKEFVEDAKKRPGEISYSSSGVYGTLHMAMEMFSHAAGINLKHMPCAERVRLSRQFLEVMWIRLRPDQPWLSPISKPGNSALGRMGSKTSRFSPRRSHVQRVGIRHRILYLGRTVRTARNARSR